MVLIFSSSHSYLRDNFKIIDPTKICAYGRGYGAYLTSTLLTKDSKRTFLCYIAVAPIVSFQYYSEYSMTCEFFIENNSDPLPPLK